ncbi:MAG: DinB family protein [Planctomycetota bacterium]
MDRIAHYRRLFEYDTWASRAAAATIARAAARAPEDVKILAHAPLRTLAHAVGAQRLWLARLRRDASTTPVWPALTLAECQSDIESLARTWTEYFATLDDAALDATIAYTNSRGERFTSRVEDVLMHVVLHGAHHRGQIASGLRAEGAEPPYIDFIHAVREGYVR